MPDKEKRHFNVPVVAIICGALGVIALALSMIVMAYSDMEPTMVLYWALGIYIFTLALIAVIGIVRKRMKTGDFIEIKGSIFGTLSLDFIQK